ncbi:MAG: hypothetical protein V3W41_09195 [Planctomycetota bacterium]
MKVEAEAFASANILAEVQKMNELKKTQIHTIAIGTGGPGGLMRALAAQDDGQYVVIW